MDELEFVLRDAGYTWEGSVADHVRALISHLSNAHRRIIDLEQANQGLSVTCGRQRYELSRASRRKKGEHAPSALISRVCARELVTLCPCVVLVCFTMNGIRYSLPQIDAGNGWLLVKKAIVFDNLVVVNEDDGDDRDWDVHWRMPVEEHLFCLKLGV